MSNLSDRLSEANPRGFIFLSSISLMTGWLILAVGIVLVGVFIFGAFRFSTTPAKIVPQYGSPSHSHPREM